MVVQTVTPTGPISYAKPGQKIVSNEAEVSGNTAVQTQVKESSQQNFDYSKENNPPKENQKVTYTNPEINTGYNLGFSATKPELNKAEPIISLNESLNIKAEDPEQVFSYSKGTKEFNKSTEETISNLKEAKAQGITELDIYDLKGNKIGSTNPQDIVRARYDILKASIKSGGPVTAKGQSDTIETTSSQTTYELKDKSKEVAGAFLAPASYIGLSLLAGAAKISGKEILGVKPTTTEEEINLKIEKQYGTKAANPLDVIFNNESLAEKVPTLIGTSAFYALGLVSGGRSSTPKEKIYGNPTVIEKIQTIITNQKQTTEIGSADIGLSLSKPSPEFVKAKLFNEQAGMLKKPDTIKANPPEKPPPKPSIIPGGEGSSFTSTKINLGKGIGKLLPNGGKASNVSDITKPKPPEKPESPKPSQREIVSKTGLVQILKEPEPIKPLTKIAVKTYLISKQKQTLSIKPKLEQIIRPTQAEKETQKYLDTIQQLRLKSKIKIDQKTGQAFEVIQSNKTMQKQSISEKQKEKDLTSFIFEQPTKTIQRHTFPNPIPNKLFNPNPTPKPPPIKTPPPPERTPNKGPPTILNLFDNKKESKKKKGKGKKRNEFLGNVPESDIIGTIKSRADITYNERTINSLIGKEKKQSKGSFIQSGNKQIKIRKVSNPLKQGKKSKIRF